MTWSLTFHFILFCNFIYLFLAVLDLCCCLSFSLVVVWGLLTVVTSPVAEQWLALGHSGFVAGVAAPGIESTGSRVMAHGLRCSMAGGIFLHQGSNSCPLHWQTASLPLSHQGSPALHIKERLISAGSYSNSYESPIHIVGLPNCLMYFD